MTKISNIVRGVTSEVGRGAKYFNDKLESGDRSIKVWGFTESDYDMLEARFQNAGYGVKRVTTPGIAFAGRLYARPQTRLHVRMPA